MNLPTNPIRFEDDVIKSLKAIRKNKKISQTALAKRLAVSRDTIARIELGKHQLRLQMVVKLANALDIALQDLLFENEQKSTFDSSISQSLNISPSWGRIEEGVNIGGETTLSSIKKHTAKLTGRNISVSWDIKNMGEFKDEKKQESRTIVEEEVKSHDTSSAPAPDPIHSPIRNPYLDEVAVKSYGNPMKQYILNQRHFWHWVPEDKLAGLSIASVVEATLNQGEEKNVKWLFETIGELKAAKVFKWGISGSRTNYRKDTISFFDAYFKRHVPEYPHL